MFLLSCGYVGWIWYVDMVRCGYGKVWICWVVGMLSSILYGLFVSFRLFEVIEGGFYVLVYFRGLKMKFRGFLV